MTPSWPAKRATSWQLKTQRLAFGPIPLVMGIVNVTPDSFSDGGRFLDPQSAIQHGLRLAAEGAEILDVGGESTRPYSTPVDTDEELRRVLPVVAALAKSVQIPISIDTTKSRVARAALDAGAEIINDISGFERDSEMVKLAKATRAGICAMHTLAPPQTMQDDPRYDDVVRDIYRYLESRWKYLVEQGIAGEQVCLDPGIGFGKTHEHNLTLLSNCYRFHQLGCPVLVGHSRKGFIGKVLGDKGADRTAGTIGVACSLAAQGVQIVRVHDVAAVKQALQLFAATSFGFKLLVS